MRKKPLRRRRPRQIALTTGRRTATTRGQGRLLRRWRPPLRRLRPRLPRPQRAAMTGRRGRSWWAPRSSSWRRRRVLGGRRPRRLRHQKELVVRHWKKSRDSHDDFFRRWACTVEARGTGKNHSLVHRMRLHAFKNASFLQKPSRPIFLVYGKRLLLQKALTFSRIFHANDMVRPLFNWPNAER